MEERIVSGFLFVLTIKRSFVCSETNLFTDSIWSFPIYSLSPSLSLSLFFFLSLSLKVRELICNNMTITYNIIFYICIAITYIHIFCSNNKLLSGTTLFSSTFRGVSGSYRSSSPWRIVGHRWTRGPLQPSEFSTQEVNAGGKSLQIFLIFLKFTDG